MNVEFDPKYPVGKYRSPALIEEGIRRNWIKEIASLPGELASAAGKLTQKQLDTPYREGGWTGRQVIHHVADSHMNSYIRFRWALTEDDPLIKTYEERLWAELPDARTGPVEVSLSLVKALHGRWVLLLESMTERDYCRVLQHPSLGELKLDWMLGLYAWHGRHHTGHLTLLSDR